MENKKIDISIVITNWNTKNMLLNCLNSIEKEKDECNLEIIVVDNGSSDGSKEAVKRKFPNVKLLCNNENIGFAKAYNIGINHCKGKYICIVNSDIKILRKSIKTMKDYMDINTSIGIMGPKILNYDLTLRKNCRKFPTLWNTFCRASLLYKIFPNSKIFCDNLMRYFDHNTIREVDIVPGCFMMVRRETIQEIGLLDEGFFIYAEDKDWCRRCKKTGWKVVFNPNAEVIHYAGASSSSESVRFWVERLRSNLYYWKKYNKNIKVKLYLIIMLWHHTVRILGWSLLNIIKKDVEKRLKGRINENKACIKWIIYVILKKLKN